MSHRKWNVFLLAKQPGSKCGSRLVYAEHGELFTRIYTEDVSSNAALSVMKEWQKVMKEWQSPRLHWSSFTGSHLIHWPSYFLGSFCKFSVTRARLHSGNIFWEEYSFTSKTISLFLGSCFTVLAEGCQNRAILPVISYYAKNKHIDMKKACKLCELLFTDVPYTDLHKVKRGEQTSCLLWPCLNDIFF